MCDLWLKSLHFLLFISGIVNVSISQIQNPVSGNIPPVNKSFQRNLFEYLKTTHPVEIYGSFVLENKRKSPAGYHYLFQQIYMGLLVYEGTIKINLDKTLKITSVFDNTFVLKQLNTEPGEIDTNIAHNFLKKHFNYSDIDYTINKVFFIEGNQLKNLKARPRDLALKNLKARSRDLAFKKGILLRYGSLNSSVGSYEILFDKAGVIIHKKDLNTYYVQSAKRKAQSVQRSVPCALRHAPCAMRYASDTTEKDSLVNVCIFNPDPLTTANVTYGSPYIDSNDVDIPELNAERDSVMITVKFKNDTFFLESPYCKIGEYDPPDRPVFIDTIADFCFTRSDTFFEQVNIFYHINYYQAYLQSLGFDSLVNYPIKVDANGMSGADNSMFSSFSNLLSFGEGGVDDGEDADVIIHEYSHAISYSAAPNTNTGIQRKTLEEANADYLAASYSYAIDTFGWQKVFNWDGHNTFWSGRWVVSAKHYPEDWVGNIYVDAVIWSATLMQIREDIGRNITDQLLIQSIYSYASNLTFIQAAYLFLEADSLINNGANYLLIYRRFKDRGILPSLPSSAVIIDKVDPVCNDSCDGQAMVIVLGGVPPYIYQWDDSLGQDSSTATGLCAGTYSVTFVDSLGDTAYATTILNEPDTFFLSFSSTPDSCPGCNNGTATVTVNGGSGNYTYQWNDPDSQATATATGLVAGDYIVVITDTVCGEVFTDTITVGSLISVSHVTNNIAKFINIFPNPTTGIFTVQSGIKDLKINSIKVYNIMGENVARIDNLSGKGVECRWSMDISIFAEGIYFVKIQTDEKIFIKKIIFIR